MKDGSRPVDVLVSNPALESIDIVPIEQDDYFATFKIYRKSFERIASQKYDKGHVEVDGTGDPDAVYRRIDRGLSAA